MATPVTKSIKPSGQSGDYTSLSAWEAQNLNLVSLDQTQMALISGDWSGINDTPTWIDGWTTSKDNSITILVSGSAKHKGMYSDLYYKIIPSGNSDLLTVYDEFVKISGLQFNGSGSGRYIDGIICGGLATPAEIIVEDCIANFILEGTITQSNYAFSATFQAAGGSNRTASFTNCLTTVKFTNPTYVNNTVGFYSQGAHWSGSAKNCTAINCDYGYSSLKSAINCIAQSSRDGFNSVTTGTNNCSDIASDAPGTNAYSGSVQFMDSASGDFRLSPYDTVAMFRGTPLTESFTTDLAGVYRGTGSVWDIGAYHSTMSIRTIKPSGQSGSYTSLSSWEAGQQQNLPSINKSVVAKISGNWSGSSDTTALTLAGWATDETHNVTIETDSFNSSSAVWDNTKYVLKTTNIGSINAANFSNLTLRGFQVFLFSNSTEYINILGLSNANNILVDSMIFRGDVNSWVIYYGIYIAGTTGKVDLRNSIVYGMNPAKASTHCIAINSTSPSNHSILNCLAVGASQTIRNYTGTSVIVKNTMTQGAGSDGFVGSFNSASSNNCSNIASDAPGTNPQTGTVSFFNAVNGDFRLKSTDTVAKGNGTDLSEYFTTDIGGNLRTIPWDIGASIWYTVEINGITYFVPWIID